MIYRIIFDDQWFRTIPSCIIDNRVALGLGNARGSVIDKYIQSHLLIGPGALTYKIETLNGNLAGVFVLQVHPMDGATILFSVIRPSFSAQNSEIMAEISTFILSNDWVYDK